MKKIHVTISLDADLYERLKAIAAERRTTVSALITQYALSLEKKTGSI